MGSAIRNLVPYQVDAIGQDLTSLKRISQRFFLKNAVQSVAPPAYGAPIAGSGDTTTLLGNFAARYAALITAVISQKLKMVRYEMKAILGYGLQSPVKVVNSIAPGAVFTLVTTSTPHGFVTGDIVNIAGVAIPAVVNGTWPIIVSSANQIQVPVPSILGSAGPGTVQKAGGNLGFLYGDLEVLVSTVTGGIAGDALPIFSNVTVRRLNSYVGKSFRSRFSMAPIAESDNDFGKLNAAAVVAWAGQLPTFMAAIPNGGTDATSGNSFHYAVSKKVATGIASPFTISNTWAAPIDSMAAHTNLGSVIKRKPKISNS